jgi:hypothetical protein
MFVDNMQNRVCQFLTSMTEHEIKHIQSIAVGYLIDEDIDEDPEYAPVDVCLDLFKKAISRMPAMKEFLIVHEIGAFWHAHSLYSELRPIQLSYESQQDTYRADFIFGDEDPEFESQKLPNSDDITKGFDVPKTGSVWGWRPTTLPMMI